MSILQRLYSGSVKQWHAQLSNRAPVFANAVQSELRHAWGIRQFATAIQTSSYAICKHDQMLKNMKWL